MFLIKCSYLSIMSSHRFSAIHKKKIKLICLRVIINKTVILSIYGVKNENIKRPLRIHKVMLNI